MIWALLLRIVHQEQSGDMNKEQAYLIILDRNHKEIWRSAGFLDAGAVKTINQTINQVLSNEKRRKH